MQSYCDENIFYLDFVVTNNEANPVLAKDIQRRSSPILYNPCEWEASVLRMQCSTREIPLFFPVIPNPAFPTTTNMSITLQYMATNFQTFIVVTPDEAKGGVFSYQNFLEHLNAASLASFLALKAAFPGASGTEPPHFYLNTVTKLISMYVQDVYLETNANRIHIGLSQQIENLVNLPYSQSFAPFPAPAGFDYEISVQNYAVLLPIPPRAGFPVALSALGGNWIQVSQGFVSTDEWDSTKGIIIVSNLLPVVREYLPNVTSPSQSQNVNNSALGILVDFELVKESAFEPRHIAQYLPTAEYKMMSLISTSPINTVDIQAYYQTYDGTLREIYLGNGQNLSLKLMFRRKFKK